MAEETKARVPLVTREKALEYGTKVIVLAAHRWVRFGVIVLFVVLLIWMVYGRVWKVLHEEVPLPLSVATEDPELDIEVLRSINTRRSERASRAPASFNTFNSIVVAPVLEDQQAGAAPGDGSSSDVINVQSSLPPVL